MSCLRRTWLLGAIGGHLDFHMARLIDVLELDDAALIELTTGELRSRLQPGHRRFGADDAVQMTARSQQLGLFQICRCDDAYPPALRPVRAAPAVLHVAGSLERFQALCGEDAVAMVGSRRATAYGLEVARTLARGVSASGLTVVSGMATGVDGAAHDGALAAGGRTVAVIAGCAAEPYPRAQRGLHRRIVEDGAVVSELAPGTAVRRWMMPARNRIIAGLAGLVILVQAAERSGAELTVRAAQEYGRAVGAVPGSVLIDQSAGPNALLAAGACVIRDAQDVLDAVFGPGKRLAAGRLEGVLDRLDESQRAVVEAIRSGAHSAGALARAGYGDELCLAVLAGLELAGVVRRGAGGRYEISA